MGFVEKLFGSFQDKEMKRLDKIKQQILQLDETYGAMSDAELRAKTAGFKSRLGSGSSLDDIVVDAFAVCREASWRVLGMKQYPVQILGGLALHNGYIAEMATGEGKTLMETLPAYLNALTGKGVHIVTVNEYLSSRDCEEMSKIFKYLGLSVGLIKSGMEPRDRQEAYKCDITYVTNSELGFDYLKDNMMLQKESKVQRGLNYCIVDEIDSVMIDDARTPLIIAIDSNVDVSEYTRVDKFVKTLKRCVVKELEKETQIDEQVKGDYVVEEKSRVVTLTDSGIEKAEQWFRCGSLADPQNMDLRAKIDQQIKANGCMERDKDYIVLDGEVQIIDQGTGRILKGRRYSDGLHQAIEAKEGVKINSETKTHASVTYQNFFKMYNKLCGMTGTAKTSEEEFKELYGLEILQIPTNKPLRRIDHPDNVYLNKQAKYKAILEQIHLCKSKGQPILIGTTSVAKSEELQRILKANKISHKVLNAKYHEAEAKIIAQAGRFGAVTIATNMAGRGTDIKLGGTPEQITRDNIIMNGLFNSILREAGITDFAGTADKWITLIETDGTVEPEYNKQFDEAKLIYSQEYIKAKETVNNEKVLVCGAGGLYVLGTERHENRRIDNQLRGRAGRQGDPGESKFFLSLDDDLIRLFGGDKMMKLAQAGGLQGSDNIQNKMISQMIEKGQKTVESQRYQLRKHMYELDDTLDKQRTIIYRQRDEVLNSENIRELVLGMIHKTIEQNCENYLTGETVDEWNLNGLKTYFLGWICTEDDFRTANSEESSEARTFGNSIDKYSLIEILYNRAVQAMNEKDRIYGKEEVDDKTRKVILHCVDSAWKQHLENMEILKKGINLVSYGQKDPVVEYRITGFEMFDEMVYNIGERVSKQVLLM